jgi:protein-S-isoprenylcysteine O-methyltransferase Ste14
MNDLSALAVTLSWGMVALVWIGAARHQRRHDPLKPAMVAAGRKALVGAALVGAIVLTVSIAGGLVLTGRWLEVLGLCVLVPATAFTIWARLALGAMWTVEARVGADRKLCTTGPYAVTRHPIYTGVIGMLLGTSLLVGDGGLILMVPLAVLLLEVRIHVEERLLLATFPDEYASYRRDVPQLVPSLRSWLRRELPRPAS